MKKTQLQKLLLIIFVLLLLLPGCQADDGMVTVYCLTDVERTSDFGETIRPPVTFSYDENGNLLGVQRIDETISERWLYAYDSRCNLIASEYFANGAPAEKSTYAYDEADRLIAKQHYGSDATLLESQHFTYDQNGNKKSSLTVDEITKMRTLLHYFYDENGTCVSIQKGSFEGHMSTYVDWIYDENGRLLEERTAANDDLDCVYTYNGNGWLLSRTIGNGFRGEYVYTHDQNGNIITATFGTKTEAPYHRQSFSYDRKGRIIEQIEFIPDGTESLKTAYSYDRFGKILSIEQISGSSRHSCELSYDKNGHILSQKTSNLYSFSTAASNQEVICTYDKNGNLIHVAVDRGFAHTYSYTAFSLPKAQADKVQAQQSDLLDHFFLWMPTEPELPQAIYYTLNEYLPKQEYLYPHMGEAFLE